MPKMISEILLVAIIFKLDSKMTKSHTFSILAFSQNTPILQW